MLFLEGGGGGEEEGGNLILGFRGEGKGVGVWGFVGGEREGVRERWREGVRERGLDREGAGGCRVYPVDCISIHKLYTNKEYPTLLLSNRALKLGVEVIRGDVSYVELCHSNRFTSLVFTSFIRIKNILRSDSPIGR